MSNEAYAVEVYESIPAWVRARRDGIGSSDAAGLWEGVDSYTSPRALYEAKVCGIEPDINPEWAEMGHLMEPVIAELYTRRTKHRLVDPGANTIYRSTRWPWMTASLDRIIDVAPQPGALECKNRGGWASQEWDAGAPLDVQLQVQHALAVTGWTWGVIGVLLGGNTPRFIRVERDEELIGMHVERCRTFWEGNVIARKAPPVDGHDATAAALRKRYEATKGKAIEMAPAAIGVHHRLRVAIDAIKVAQAAKQQAENELLELMADAEIAKLPGGLGEYKRINVKASSYTVNRAAYSFPKYKEAK